MPQMAPINWLSLYFIFCMTFITFNLLNYFSFIIYNTNKKNCKNNKEMKTFNWKW